MLAVILITKLQIKFLFLSYFFFTVQESGIGDAGHYPQTFFSVIPQVCYARATLKD
jgi:hypothetical protein